MSTEPAPKLASGPDAPVSQPASPEADGSPARRRIGLLVGVLLAGAAFLALPDSLSTGGRITAAIAILMAVWWMTEAIPIPATALLPLVLFPLFGVSAIGDVAAPYADDIIFLFMGGFMLALAMQRWNLHRRIALTIVAAVGTSPVMLIAGFMLATGFITMWVSNTATSVMMLPIGLSVLGLVTQLGDGKGDANFSTSLMLGIAYSSSIGSVSTIIGTPPNALMVGYLADNHGIEIGFGQWMLIGVPLAAVFLVLAWVVLTRFVYPPKIKRLPGGRALIREQLHEMGPMSRGEWTVLAVFVCAALAWVFVPLLADSATVGGALPWLANVSDAGIAMTVAVALFLIPVDARKGVAVLDWETALKLPWGVLLLFGGGLSLSSQFTATGLSEWIGGRVGVLNMVPGWVLILIVAALVLLLTELTSNTATAATFLPVMGGVAVGLDMDVMTLIIPTALAASLAFMLPVATPPNAIAFGSGYIKIGQMVKAGIWLNLIALVLVMIVMYTVAAWAFGL
ncbi:sodium-dependent dicarboxylate transporter 2/3/5 [Spinactinospora alkalitolerans]|uniref:Sodium-dependent dicarboxylate transporter SdcS n=1 Tax=Spinactinospora alkalitolerans TaxID=687207 RepID=A0A852TM68_9ACTN|nr:DASS family sodium-coupled anion symporter [Spinactinospora alkalitolerans]NYE45049.1 sodium-dependent dicarboxylate transporter 2/3/5 [Spinactinospora alkalitolerans]